MPGLIRDFSADNCGNGNIGTPKQSFCFADGYKIALLGEKVNKSPHDTTMVQSSAITYIGGIGVCRNGDLAGDASSARYGSSAVFADDYSPPPGAFDVVDYGEEVLDSGVQVVDT